MVAMTWTFSSMAILVGAMATLLVWWARSGKARVVIAAAALAVMPMLWWAALDLLGRPRPVAFVALAGPSEMTVLGAKIVEDSGMWLLLDAASWPEPRHVWMPWDAKRAQRLQAALGLAEELGMPVRMRATEDSSWRSGQEWAFHVEPMPAPPLKMEDPGESPIVLPGS